MAEQDPVVDPRPPEELLEDLRRRFPENEYRISVRDDSKVQRKYVDRWKNICEHNRITITCKDCGGASICEHKKIRSACKECGGSQICSHNRLRTKCKECGGGHICEHNKERSACKKCGGASICEHNRIRSQCRECGGNSVCKHDRLKTVCKECKGGSICEHNKVRSRCKECGGGHICEHNKQKHSCKECRGTSICKHNRRRNTCKECGGASICEHKRRRSQCKECGGSQICSHGRVRSNCKDCKGPSVCEHNERRSECKECEDGFTCEHGRTKGQCEDCGTSSICPCGGFFKVKDGFCARCLKCNSEGCVRTPSKTFDYTYCYRCGCVKYGRTPQEKRQDKVFNFLQNKYPDCVVRYEQQFPDQSRAKCTPFAQFVLPHRTLIIELGENGHKTDQHDRETKHMCELAAIGHVSPTVFVRLNLDVYTDTGGNKRKISLEKRLEKLRSEIDHWLDIESTQQHFITLVYLYYDKSEVREESFILFDCPEM